MSGGERLASLANDVGTTTVAAEAREKTCVASVPYDSEMVLHS